MIRTGARRLGAAMIRGTGCARKMWVASRNAAEFAAPERTFASPWRSVSSPRPFCAQPLHGKDDKAATPEEILAEATGGGAEEVVPEMAPEAAREAADLDEFRSRYETMKAMSGKLQRSMAAMGTLQLLSGWYIVASQYQAHTLYFFFTGLSATLSFQVMYLLRSALAPPAKLPDDKPLTLPIVSVRSMANFLARTHLIVCISATGLGLSFAYDVVPAMVR